MSHAPSARRLSAIAVLLALPGLASAASNYNYVEGGFIHRDDYGRSGAGGRIAGSVDLDVPIAPFAEFSSTDDLDQISAGAVFHAPIRRDLDWFGGGSLEHVDNNRRNDTGFGLRGGIHWQTTQNLELAPELRYVDVYDDGQVSARINAAYTIAPHFALVAAAQGGDDDRFEAGVRYRFGKLF